MATDNHADPEVVFIRAGFALMALVAVLISASCGHSRMVIRDMVQAGADPIAAKCAVGSESTTLCVLHEARR